MNKVTVKDHNTQSDTWLAWCIDTAREYSGNRLQTYLDVNGFNPTQRARILEALQ